MSGRHPRWRRSGPTPATMPLSSALPLEVDACGRLPKELAACCAAARDELGRYPIGYCGPACERRELLAPWAVPA